MTIPEGLPDAELEIGSRKVHLTNLNKPFWPELNLTKRDLLQYYADVAPVLRPHLAERAMVMKRYPNGAHGDFFFMKRTPDPHPDWLQTCSISHASASVIAFPVIDDLAALLWVVNLGCIPPLRSRSRHGLRGQTHPLETRPRNRLRRARRP